MKLRRLCISPKDISIITGKSEKYSRQLLKMLRKKLNKKDHQNVSFGEFLEFIDIPAQEFYRLFDENKQTGK